MPLPQTDRLRAVKAHDNQEEFYAGGMELDRQVAQIANKWRDGDVDAGDRLFRELADDLRAIAQARLHTEKSQSLSAGDLVNEAVLRMMRLDRIEWANRPHILAMAATTMRQFLLDHARRANRDKRAHRRVTLCTSIAQDDPPIDVIALDDALQRLGEIDPQRAAVVEMRYFGGMTVTEIAAVIELSESTVKRHWTSARTWLQERLDH